MTFIKKITMFLVEIAIIMEKQDILLYNIRHIRCSVLKYSTNEYTTDGPALLELRKPVFHSIDLYSRKTNEFDLPLF